MDAETWLMCIAAALITIVIVVVDGHLKLQQIECDTTQIWVWNAPPPADHADIVRYQRQYEFVQQCDFRRK